jgi:hypothetical protein
MLKLNVVPAYAYRAIKAYGERGGILEIIALIQNSDALVSFTICTVKSGSVGANGMCGTSGSETQDPVLEPNRWFESSKSSECTALRLSIRCPQTRAHSELLVRH